MDGGPEKVVYCQETLRHQQILENEEKAEESGDPLPAPDPQEVATSDTATAKGVVAFHLRQISKGKKSHDSTLFDAGDDVSRRFDQENTKKIA